MFAVAADRRCRTPPAAPCLWWQWFLAGWPKAGGGLNADDIGKADLCCTVAEVGVCAVAGVDQNSSASMLGRPQERHGCLTTAQTVLYAECRRGCVPVSAPYQSDHDDVAVRQSCGPHFIRAN